VQFWRAQTSPFPPAASRVESFFLIAPPLVSLLVQDNVVILTTRSAGTAIGNYVTIGHNAVLTGCTIGDASLIGTTRTLLKREKERNT
jgi:hypothetical protein